MRPVIAGFKLLLFFTLCLISFPAIIIWRMALGKSRYFLLLPRLFHRLTLKIFCIKVAVSGETQSLHTARPPQTVYVGNHLSYIDIPVLGSILPAYFIAKNDVKGWPVLGPLATLARTIYIDRDPQKSGRTLQTIKERLHHQESLILFPEGTSTDGRGVFPFKSSGFQIFLDKEFNNILLQPFAITLDNYGDNGMLYTWHGDQTLEPHLWRLAKSKGLTVTVTLFPPIRHALAENRKKLAFQCFTPVSECVTSNHQMAEDAMILKNKMDKET